MALSTECLAARVMVAGKNPLIIRTLTKLLELDDHIEVVGEAPDLIIADEPGQYAGGDAKVCLLSELRDLTVTELLETVKHMDAAGLRQRHLHAVTLPPQRDALATLSERELEVVRLVAEGLSNKEISSRLSLSDKTVKNHISHILAKMNLTARTQVAVYAIRAGLV